ncbi:MAG: YfiR family protein [Candidatus Eisenbacteria bacterium]
MKSAASIREAFVIAILAALVIGAGPVRAGGEDQSAEGPLKAAFLYQFTKFITWPAETFASPGDPIRIVVVADDEFGELVESAVAGRRVGGRPFEVRRLEGLENLPACNILFVCERVEDEYVRSDESIRRPGMLTVGETDRFMRSGGIIRFFVEERKLRFEVNTEAAGRAGLSISSEMLKLARIVKDAALLFEGGGTDLSFAYCLPLCAPASW